MPVERINSIYDLQALEAEHAQYLSILKDGADKIVEANQKRVSVKGADLSGFTKATTELNTAINETNQTTQKTIKTQADFSETIKKVASSQENVNKVNEIGIKQSAQISQGIKAVTNLINQRFATEAKLQTVQTDYNKQTIAEVSFDLH